MIELLLICILNISWLQIQIFIPRCIYFRLEGFYLTMEHNSILDFRIRQSIPNTIFIFWNKRVDMVHQIDSAVRLSHAFLCCAHFAEQILQQWLRFSNCDQYYALCTDRNVESRKVTWFVRILFQESANVPKIINWTQCIPSYHSNVLDLIIYSSDTSINLY